MEVVQPLLAFPDTPEAFVRPCPRGGTLVGERCPDTHCRDPKAVNRAPYILLFGYLHGRKVDEETVAEVMDSLRRLRLQLPNEKGICDSLCIRLSPTPHVAPNRTIASDTTGMQ